jgi:hypothetical protein
MDEIIAEYIENQKLKAPDEQDQDFSVKSFSRISFDIPSYRLSVGSS